MQEILIKIEDIEERGVGTYDVVDQGGLHICSLHTSQIKSGHSLMIGATQSIRLTSFKLDDIHI